VRDPDALFGRLGIGRLAVLRIGSLSKWTSISLGPNGQRLSVMFTVKEDLEQKLQVTQKEVEDSVPTGTTITILNLRDSDASCISTTRVGADLVNQFCTYLLANRHKEIVVNGTRLDVSSVVASRTAETIPPFEDVPTASEVLHVILTMPVEKTVIKDQLIFSSRGRTVKSCDPGEELDPKYLSLVDCPYLDEIVSSNREGVIEFDLGFSRLKNKAIERACAFNDQYRSAEQRKFIERARLKEYYPYRVPVDNVISSVKRDLFDVVLERVHEEVNIETLSKKQQAVIFRLLKRVLESDDMLDVLTEVASLSNDDVEKFRKVLERTTLTSIIKLSSEVGGRIDFLDILHDLVYGDVAKLLKERRHLHKIIEPNCWIFSQKYHLATSDRSFREIVRRHREKAGLPDIDDDAIACIEGVEQIPDLFLAAQRDYPVHPKHHHVLVELKAPRVPLGPGEVEQVRRYADVISESPEFDKESTFWDIYLVSAKISDRVAKDRSQKGKEHGVLWQWDMMTVWAFEWSEIISRANEEMASVKQHLEKKTRELSVSEYLRHDFPDVLADIVRGHGERQPPAMGQ
jgi:hypothetical protein